MKSLRPCLLIGLGLVATTAIAHGHPGHDGHDVTWDFQSGFAHPFSGVDHLLALTAIGWWAAQLGDRARFAVPLGLLGVLAGGAVLGVVAGTVPAAVEQGVAASVVISGLLVAGAVRLPLRAAAVLVGIFGLFHGFAHGAELPAGVSPLGYASGFLAASAALLAAGVTLGTLARRLGRAPERLAGVACAAAGLLLLCR